MRPVNHLVVFAREARMGRVKTRLAAGIGVVDAWRFYRHTLARTLRVLGNDRRWRCWLAATPDGAFLGDPLCPPDYWRISQGSGDLGQRMGRVMAALPPGPVVIVGADIPDIRAADVARAFRLLGAHDAVVGPAADGGYWLIGLKRRPRLPDVFGGVRWSSSHALADTLANLPAGHTVAYLDELADIDDAEALERWRSARAGSS